MRSQKKQATDELQINHLTSIEEESIDTEAIKAEVLHAIYAAIEQLPKKCRRIIQLSFIEGKKLEEIAAEMNIAYHTVQNQKTRGLKLLRIALLENPLLTPALLAACLLFLEEGIIFWDKASIAAL